MPTALRERLVLDLDRVGPGPLQHPYRALHPNRVAEACVRIDDQREVDRIPVRVQLSADGRRLEAYRDWDRLVGTVSDGTDDFGTEYSVGRMDAWSLVTCLHGDEPPQYSGAAEERELLEVTFDHWAGRSAGALPMSVTESVSVLRNPVRTGGWATYATRSGAVVQHMWQAGPKLWLESPDQAAGLSRGRHVTLAEAEQMITILAREDRVAIGDLGETREIPW